MQSSSTVSDESKPVDSTTTVTIEILKIIKESQQQHGLRHSDYQRYRSYCTRRLRRLRKTLHFACGNMRRFQKREINMDDLTDGKLLLIPLFQAERAWAFAMQLKQESNTEPRKKFHLVNRLRKAMKLAADLEKLSQSSKCDARTKLEAQGYNSIMNGQFYFEAQKWIESLKYFNLAKQIYEKLSHALKGDDSQVFYSQKVEEIIPNIRYCNYNLGDESAKKDLIDMKLKSSIGSEIAENIDSLISQTKEKQIVTFSEISWRNKITLQVKNEKVKLFLLNVQEYEKQIQASDDVEVKISIHENILKESVDVIQLIRDELKMDQSFQLLQRGQPLPDEKPSNLLLLFSYLTWMRLNKTIERNLLLIESYKLNEDKSKPNKPQDIVRLFEIILQNLQEMCKLPGLFNDQVFLSDNEVLTIFYKAYRAYYISLFYLANKKYKEAAGFFFRSENYKKSVETNLKSLHKSSEILKNRAELDEKLKLLAAELNQSKYKIQTAAILEDSTSDVIDAKEAELIREKMSKIPLNERLDSYFEDLSLTNKSANVVKLPLSFEPIPCKPLFFDLALNHIELPSYEDKIDSKKQQQQQGVKGFIKGFFGF